MYLTPTSNHWACDIEADGLRDTVTRIWCATVLNMVTKEERTFTSAEEFKAFQEQNPDAIYVGHNFVSYDAPVLNRFWGAGIPVSRIVDTFVLSQLYNPNLPGGHRLKDWGISLRYHKGEFDDFSALTPKMIKYCIRDSRLTGLIFKRLTERMRQTGFSERGCMIEHLAWNIIQNKQKQAGFPFDEQKAQELLVVLRAREEELKNDIYRLWPPVLQCVASRGQTRKKDGGYTKKYVEDRGKFPKLEERSDGGYDVYDYVAFNLGSPSQRVTKLLELGWQPVKFTKKTKKGGGGNPQVDEDSLLDFALSAEVPEATSLAKWIVINSRANMVETWLNALNSKTGAIHGSLFIASTLRYKHSAPNSANIPGVRHIKTSDGERIAYGEEGGFTHECRDLWTCGDKDRYDLVGIDGKGMQLRCLAHNVAKTVGRDVALPFIERVLDGDPHTHNGKVLGLANKPAAKKFLYTTLMGGGGAKLAVDQAQFGTKLTEAEGNEKKNLLIDSVPGFRLLIKNLQASLQKTGRIVLCDGTPILVPSDHMVIPYLLQGDESRLMKQALIFTDRIILKNKWQKHVWKVADIHDEWQYVADMGLTEEFVEAALPCFVEAGNSFDYLIKIEGDAKVGKTWAETH